MGIQLGRVTDTPGARVHLVVNGRSHCPVVSRRQICRPSRPGMVQPEQVCRFCSRRANVEAAEREGLSATGRDYSPALADLMCRLVEATRTPAERERAA